MGLHKTFAGTKKGLKSFPLVFAQLFCAFDVSCMNKVRTSATLMLARDEANYAINSPILFRCETFL